MEQHIRISSADAKSCAQTIKKAGNWWADGAHWNIVQLLAQQQDAWHLKCRKRPQFDNKCLTTEVDVQQVLVRAQFIAAGRMIAGSTPLLQCVS